MTKGHQLRKEQLQEILKQLVETAHATCQEHDIWQRRIGEINMLKFVLSLEDVDKQQYEALDDLVFTDEVSDDTGGNTLED